MDAAIGHETVFMDHAPLAQHLQHDDGDVDDDVVSFHCTKCNLTLASSSSLKRHQQSKKHQAK